LDFFRDRGFETVVSIFETLVILFENPKLQATDQRGLQLGNYLTQLSVSGRPALLLAFLGAIVWPLPICGWIFFCDRGFGTVVPWNF
jgi:hypothetical protein